MVANLAVRHNPNGDLRPDREGSIGRSEGVTTLLMVVGRATMLHEPKRRSGGTG